jgi:hypothetical protein
MKLKPIIFFLAVAALPFLIMVAINELPTNPAPTGKYVQDRCTRHCHDVGCQHFKQSYAAAPTNYKRINKAVFDSYVYALHNNPLGLNYGAINLLIFILLYPLIGGILLWRIVKYYFG